MCRQVLVRALALALDPTVLVVVVPAVERAARFRQANQEAAFLARLQARGGLHAEGVAEFPLGARGLELVLGELLRGVDGGHRLRNALRRGRGLGSRRPW